MGRERFSMSSIKLGPDFIGARQLQEEQARRAAKLADPTRVVSFWPRVPPRACISGSDTASWYRQAVAIRHYTGIRMVVASGEIMDHGGAQ